jgi:hypothetical protein
MLAFACAVIILVVFGIAALYDLYSIVTNTNSAPEEVEHARVRTPSLPSENGDHLTGGFR